MRVPFVIALLAFGAGAVLWVVAAITAFGSVSGESSDPSQTARIIEAVPAWVGTAKTAGLTAMVLALLGAGVAWLLRR